MTRSEQNSSGGRAVGKQRNSSIELLRIISMLMIIVHHYAVHGGVDVLTMRPGVNHIFLTLSALGNVGVTIFVLITGFYMGRSEKPLKLKKVLNLVALVTFYSIASYAVMCWAGQLEFGWQDFIKVCLPLLFEEYWFASAYVLLYIFHPYINKLLKVLGRKEQLCLIWMGIIIFSILHTLTRVDYYGSPFVQFILFYMIGDYLARYPDNAFARKKFCYTALAATILVIVGYVVLKDYVGFNIPFLVNDPWFLLLNRVSPIAILLSVSVFSCFAYMQPFYHPVVNAVAATTFGIYLIHDSNSLRFFWWRTTLHNAEVADSKYMILHLLFAVVVTFGICMILELIRQWVVRIASPPRSRR